jgi:acetyl esterase
LWGCHTGSPPEHPFPAGLHDCADVLQWMHDTRPGGLDPQRIAVGGESAGGNLTVALCLYVRDNSGPAIGHQSVYYPFTDTSVSSPTLSPATVITCGHDVLHTDGVRLVEALRAAGVETLHTHYADMPHGFPMFTRLTRRADESMNEMAREVTKRLGTAEAKPSPGPRLG